MKIAVVTGASSGMGREFVQQLGYFYKTLDEIWVIARRRERLEELAEKSRVPLRIFDGDLQKKKVYKKFCEALKEERPDIRMLVNSAGFGKSGAVTEIAGEEFRSQPDMVDLNCRALTRMTLLCLPYMKKGSRIVNLASAAAFCPQPSFAVYAATKAYVLSFSQSAGSGARFQRDPGHGSMSGTGRHRILRCERKAGGSPEETDTGAGPQSCSSGAEGQPCRKACFHLWHSHESCISGGKTGPARADPQTGIHGKIKHEQYIRGRRYDENDRKRRSGISGSDKKGEIIDNRVFDDSGCPPVCWI